MLATINNLVSASRNLLLCLLACYLLVSYRPLAKVDEMHFSIFRADSWNAALLRSMRGQRGLELGIVVEFSPIFAAVAPKKCNQAHTILHWVPNDADP